MRTKKLKRTSTTMTRNNEREKSRERERMCSRAKIISVLTRLRIVKKSRTAIGGMGTNEGNCVSWVSRSPTGRSEKASEVKEL